MDTVIIKSAKRCHFIKQKGNITTTYWRGENTTYANEN